MEKRNTHVRSTLVAAVAMGIIMLVASSWTPGRTGFDARSLLVQLAPHPRDHVRIVEGTRYTVPAEKLVTIKAISATGEFPDPVILQIDGQSVALLRVSGAGFPSPTGVEEIAFGLTARSGQVITLMRASTFGTDQTVVHGFLSDV